jgi:hypothetical protein
MTMVPMPVTASEVPLMTPGPDTTEKVTGSPEVAVAERVMGPTPETTGDSGAGKLMVCGVVVTAVAVPLRAMACGRWW